MADHLEAEHPHADRPNVNDGRIVDTPSEASWTDRALEVLTGLSLGSVVGCGLRAFNQHTRLITLKSARPIDVEHLGNWFDAQSKLQDSSYGHTHSAPLPPQYVSISGRTACSNPITSQYADPPVQSIWYSKLETKTFLKLFPFTRLKMVHQDEQTAYFETRDFELVPSSSRASAAAASASVAATSTAATAASFSPSVSIPSTLPADPTYFRGLLREVSDVVRDVSMSSSDFLKSLEQGRVHAKERNIERVIPVGQPTTVIGWVSRDAQGKLSVLSGQRAGTGMMLPAKALATQALLPRGGTPVRMRSDALTDVSSSTDVHSSFLQQPDLQAYSYSSNDHPCIISHKSHARILEDERAALSSSKKLLWISVGLTVSLSLILLSRYAWKQWNRHAELARLLAFHEARKERREARVREKKEKERRRREKRKQKELAKEQALMKQARIDYFNAAAAAAAALTNSPASSLPPSSQEGIPSVYNPSGLSPSPRPHPLAPSSRTSASPVTVPGYGGRAASPFLNPQQRPMMEQLLPSRPMMTGAAASSSSSTSAAASSYEDDIGSIDSASDGAASPHTDSDAVSEDGNSMCIICAELKADACLLPCAHLFTCITCASKLTQCPVCRKHIEKIVKVFSQQL